MLIEHQTAVFPEAHVANVRLSPPNHDERGALCVRQYNALINNFRTLFTACREPNASPNRSQFLLDIVLTRTETGQTDNKVIVRTVQPAYTASAVSFNQAQGFDANQFVHVPEKQDYRLVNRASYSLGHLACDDADRLFSAGSWNAERVARTSSWLREKLPESDETLQKLFCAASDPNLNPKLAENIALNPFTTDSFITAKRIMQATA